jgi:hypothetical protein
MHARQIESALKTVIARLKSKEAARSQTTMENVLIEYGDENNLAPAQLEKLAQTLNLTLTLSHAKQANPDGRGDTFDIVSTPQLLSRFMDPERKPEKSAADKGLPEDGWTAKLHKARAKDFKAPANGLVDIPDKGKLPTMKVASAQCEELPSWQGFTVGDHFKDTPRSAPRWATIDKVMDNPQQTSGWHKEASAALRAPTVNAAVLSEMADTAWVNMRNGLNKLAALMRHNVGIYPEIIQDIRACNVKGAAVVSLFDRHLDALVLPRSPVPPDTRDFYRDRHKVAAIVDAILDAHEERQACLAVREDILRAKEAGTATETRPDTSVKKKERRADIPDPNSYFPDRVVAENTTPQALRDALFSASSLGQGVAGAGASAAQGLASQTSNVLPTATDQAQRMSDGYATLFGDSHSKQYNRLATKMEAWQQGAVLQRLLMTDEVLSKMDPSQVIGAFQTLRANSPRVARDINVSRTLLREALQHQGVPLQQIKTLRDVEGKTRPDPTVESNSKERS